MGRQRKARGTKRANRASLWTGGGWAVHRGELKRGVGNPGAVGNLFRWVGEKLPWESLKAVSAALKTEGVKALGVYIAHDSMGCPRYIGRGKIFARLRSHKRRHPRELVYFSFYLVEEKKHEREIETLLIRAAGFLLEFNDRKKRVGVSPGSIRDYEAGTKFFERRRAKRDT